MKKKLISTFATVLVLALALFAFCACDSTDTVFNEELLSNGNFETYTENESGKAVLNGWKYSEDWSNSSYALKPLSTAEKNHELDSQLGERYLEVKNNSSASVFLYQSVKVDRKAIYKITFDVRLSSTITSGRGAYVTFAENTGYYFAEQKTVYGENDGWKSVTVYVNNLDSDYLTLRLMLGSAEETSTGTVYYDNVSMQKVEEAAAGYNVYNFKKAEISRYNTNVSGILFVVFISLATVLAAAGIYVVLRRLYSRPTAFLNFSQVNGGVSKIGAANGRGAAFVSNPWFIAAVLAVFTFLLNLIFLLSMYGFGSEMNYTVQLAQALGKGGAVRSAYATFGTTLESTSPGVLYILAIIGAMGSKLDYEGISILIRMVNVLASMATVVMIFLYGRKYVGDRQSTLYAVLYAILPIGLIMSGLDNTFTVLLSALTLAAMLLLVEKKYILSYVVMVAAILLDIRALALVPLMVTYLGYRYYNDDENLKKFGKNRAIIVFGLLGAFAMLYILLLPVSIDYINDKPFQGFTFIANEIIKNKVFVDNALGLYGMAAMNQKGSSQTASVLNFVFLLVLMMYVISLYVKNRNKQEFLMVCSFTFAIVAVFTLKVDYTYLFLALALGFVYTMISGEKRMYGILSAYALLAFLNIGQLMSNSGYVVGTTYFAQDLGAMYFVNFETTSPDFIIFSIFAVLATLYYGYVSYSIANSSKLVDIPPMSKPFKVTLKLWFENFGRNMSNFFNNKTSAD